MMNKINEKFTRIFRMELTEDFRRGFLADFDNLTSFLHGDDTPGRMVEVKELFKKPIADSIICASHYS